MEKKLLNAIFDQSAIPMAIIDLNSSFLYTNKAFGDFTGYTLYEVNQLNCKDIIHIEDYIKNGDKIKTLLKGEIKSFQVEMRFNHKGGHTIWGILTATFISKENENQSYILVQVQDITESKKMEVRLQESENLYRILADNSSDIISTYSIDGVCQYVSPSIERRLGYKTQEFMGKAAFSFFHPEDILKIQEELSNFWEAPTTNTTIHRLLHKDGHYLWFESKIKCLFENNQPQNFLVTSRDITPRIEILNELDNSNRRINNILESITDGFIALDLEDRFIYVNKAAEKIVNRRREELLNNPWYEVYTSGVNKRLKENYYIVK